MFGRETTKYTVIYNVYVRSWPTLAMCSCQCQPGPLPSSHIPSPITRAHFCTHLCDIRPFSKTFTLTSLISHSSTNYPRPLMHAPARRTSFLQGIHSYMPQSDNCLFYQVSCCTCHGGGAGGK